MVSSVPPSGASEDSDRLFCTGLKQASPTDYRYYDAAAILNQNLNKTCIFPTMTIVKLTDP